MVRRKKNEENFLERWKERDMRVPEEERIQDLVDEIERICCWKDIASLFISPDGYTAIRESKKAGHFITDLEKLKKALIDRGYNIEEGIYINLKFWVIESKERPTFFVIPLEIIDDAPDGVKREFEQYRGKLFKFGELPAGFEIKIKYFMIPAFSLADCDFILRYRGYVCTRLIFSYSSKLGWYNITYDKPQTPEECIKEEMKALA
jgi:hypothetical protein